MAISFGPGPDVAAPGMPPPGMPMGLEQQMGGMKLEAPKKNGKIAEVVDLTAKHKEGGKAGREQDADLEGWTLKKAPASKDGTPSWLKVTRKEMGFTQEELQRQIKERGERVYKSYQNLTQNQRTQVDQLIDDKNKQEPSAGRKWELVCITTKTRTRGWSGPVERLAIFAIMKREKAKPPKNSGPGGPQGMGAGPPKGMPQMPMGGGMMPPPGMGGMPPPQRPFQGAFQPMFNNGPPGPPPPAPPPPPNHNFGQQGPPRGGDPRAQGFGGEPPRIMNQGPPPPPPPPAPQFQQQRPPSGPPPEIINVGPPPPTPHPQGQPRPHGMQFQNQNPPHHAQNHANQHQGHHKPGHHGNQSPSRLGHRGGEEWPDEFDDLQSFSSEYDDVDSISDSMSTPATSLDSGLPSPKDFSRRPPRLGQGANGRRHTAGPVYREHRRQSIPHRSHSPYSPSRDELIPVRRISPPLRPVIHQYPYHDEYEDDLLLQDQIDRVRDRAIHNAIIAEEGVRAHAARRFPRQRDAAGYYL